MASLKEAFDFVCGYTRVLFRALPILWSVAPKELTFMATAVLLQGLTPAISVWVTKRVVDTVTEALTQGKESSFRVFGGLVAAWFGALLLETSLDPWVVAVQGNLNEKLTAHLNLLLMRKAEGFPDLSHFEDPRFYDELQIIRQKANYQLSNLLTYFANGIRQLFTVLAMFGLLVPVGFWIPFLLLGTTLPQAYISFRLELDTWETMVGKSFQARQMEYCASVMLTDAYAKEVRLFRLGPFFITRYLEAFQDMHQAMRHLRGKQARRSTNLVVLSTLGNALAFYWVVQQAFRGQLSSGSVLLFIQALAYIQQNLSLLVMSSTWLYEILLHMERLFNFLESKPTMAICSPGKPVPRSIRLGINFDGVYFSYPDGRYALKGISFTLYPGETVALVGENGAGKTTVVKLLARLYDPTAGTIWVDGENLKDLDLEAWRRQIAVVFQDFGRYALTLAENIALGDLKVLDDLERLRRANQRAGMAEIVEQFPEGYQTSLGKQFGGTELSGGEWQKLALARAFVREEEAQLLILDEPTAALDPRSESEVYRRFAELAHGKTTLLITHRLASVRMADRILVLKNGHLLEEGTHEELLQRRGEYATLWSMQAQQYGF